MLEKQPIASNKDWKDCDFAVEGKNPPHNGVYGCRYPEVVRSGLFVPGYVRIDRLQTHVAWLERRDLSPYRQSACNKTIEQICSDCPYFKSKPTSEESAKLVEAGAGKIYADMAAIEQQRLDYLSSITPKQLENCFGHMFAALTFVDSINNGALGDEGRGAMELVQAAGQYVSLFDKRMGVALSKFGDLIWDVPPASAELVAKAKGWKSTGEAEYDTLFKLLGERAWERDNQQLLAIPQHVRKNPYSHPSLEVINSWGVIGAGVRTDNVARWLLNEPVTNVSK